jgi:hypothetical protein
MTGTVSIDPIPPGGAMNATPAARRSCALLACLLFAGCSPERKADTRFEDNKALFASFRDADKLTVYEGLPHQVWESKQLDKEKQAKPTVQLHGFPFYRETLEVKADDQKALRKLLGDEGSFKQWMGEKKCGGFHPDYLVELRAGDTDYRFLICFGCQEVKVFEPEKSSRWDMTKETSKQLEGLLKKYQKNRPAPRAED